MEKTRTAVTATGTWVLRRPTAKERNQINMECSTAANTEQKEMMFRERMLPVCITQRPDSVDKTVPLKDILGSLDYAEYDELCDELLILFSQTDDKKKQSSSSQPSEVLSSPNGTSS